MNSIEQLVKELIKAGKHEEGACNLEELLKMQPDNMDALNALMLLYINTKNLSKAATKIEFMMKLSINNFNLILNYANLKYEMDNIKDALFWYEKAEAIDSKNFLVYSNKTNALLKLGELDDALTCVNRALKLNDKDAKTWMNHGNVLSKLRKFQDAIQSYEVALNLDVNSADAWFNYGNALLQYDKTDQALKAYENSMLLQPNYSSRVIFESEKTLTESLKSVLFQKAEALKKLEQHGEAAQIYEDILKTDENAELILGAHISHKQRIAAWEGINELKEKMALKIKNGIISAEPFVILSLYDDPQMHQVLTKKYTEKNYPRKIIPKFDNKKNEKIKIAYFSADFYLHATSYLMAQLFELHDRNRFEIIAFSFSPDKEDEMSKRIRKGFDNFIDVRNLSDEKIAALSRNIGIDIAVDLKGYTSLHRMGIFASGAAPIQVNYLGYPGTLGADYIDYIVADKIVITPENRLFINEKIVYLPDSYQCNDQKREIANVEFKRSDFGLPEDKIVYCCFNDNYKITSEVFHKWINILRRVPDSVLWLISMNDQIKISLRNILNINGIDSKRLIFGLKIPVSSHLARHQLADLFLDTLPYNAHTTASDALWAGLPVLTCAGKSFAGRVGASLLNAVGLPELVVATLDEYEDMAVSIGLDKNILKNIRTKLANNLEVAPLFDTPKFTKNLEMAYEIMFDKYISKEPFSDINISN